MEKKLQELFENKKNELTEKLKNLSLPQDADKVQKVVAQHLDDLFNAEGDFRQGLTQSEDYIMQAAITLLNAQQSMVLAFSPNKKKGIPGAENSRSAQNAGSKPSSLGLSEQKYPQAIGATAVGGAVGGLILGTWGAVFGAIAGTAVMLYAASPRQQQAKSAATESTKVHSETINNPTDAVGGNIDVEQFTQIISNICHSVDSLIESFRTQINRVVKQYEDREKPTLERDYNTLLETIQSLVGFERTRKDSDARYIEKINDRIEELAESLDNYDLEVVNYDGTNDVLFDKIPSAKTTETRMVTPAIVKDNTAVIKGKLFVQE